MTEKQSIREGSLIEIPLSENSTSKVQAEVIGFVLNTTTKIRIKKPGGSIELRSDLNNDNTTLVRY